MKLTVLYYTANVELESFESKIRGKLIENMGDLPLVSVSQKPLKGFGKNICVGIHDNCYLNAFRQMQIGLNEIDSDYILAAEADFLYPPEYFTFKPPQKGKCYRYFGVWVCYLKHKAEPKPHFHFKGYSNGAQIIDRKLWLGKLEKILNGRKEWASVDDRPINAAATIKTNETYTWVSDNPIVTFKTRQGINIGTALQKKVYPKSRLPYWGNIKDLRKEMFV